MKKSLYTLLLIHFIVFVISCDKADDRNTANSPSESYLTTAKTISNDGCKSYYNRNSLPVEVVELKTVDDSKLQVTHKNTILNCQPGKIIFDCKAGEGVILITEQASENSANCVCPYDLTYIVDVPSYGNYSLKINSTEFGKFEFNAETNISLNKYLTPNS